MSTSIAEALARMPKMKQLVEQNVEPDESLHVLIVGAHNQLVVGTSRRVLVLKKGLMAGATLGHKVSSWEFKNVTGIQLDIRVASGILIVHAGGEEPVKASYWATGKGSASEAPNAITFSGKPDAGVHDAVARLRDLIAQAQSSGQTAAIDPMEQLRKLAELRDAGVVTPDEFERKKRDLLDRI